MYTRIHVLIVLAGIMFILADTSSADVPAPPVNQNLGIVDFQFGDQVEADCRVCHGITVQVRHDSLDGQSIPPGSLVPYRDVDGNGLPDPAYSCESCHGPGFIPGSSPVERDCTACHNTTSPHHQTPEALARNCVACHGDFVDNADDGHDIPSYSPSLITPWATDKSSGGQPANSRGTSAGSCNYCHDDDGLVTPKSAKMLYSIMKRVFMEILQHASGATISVLPPQNVVFEHARVVMALNHFTISRLIHLTLQILDL